MDIETTFENYMRAVISSMKEYEKRLTFLSNQMRKRKVRAVPEDGLNIILGNIPKFLENVEADIAAIDNVLAEMPPTICWVPEEKERMEMSWETGITPWSVWLKYKNRTEEISELIQQLKQKWINGELEHEHFPEVGMYVAICTTKRVYRGLIISLDSKLKVLNVDDGKERGEEQNSCYKLIKEFSEIHANVIQCSIGRENFEGSWKMNYFQNFVSLLQYSRLTVSVVEEADNIPPIFIIDLFAFNEDSESEINVSEWVQERCSNVKPLTEEMRLSPSMGAHVKKESILKTMSPVPTNLSRSEEQSVKQEKVALPSLKTPSPLPTLVNGFTNDESHGGNRFLKVAHVLNMSTQGMDQSKKKSSFKFEEVIDAPEFLPIQKSENEKKDTGCNFMPMNGTHESSVIPGQYNPTDDNRICAFFSKHNYCWKLSCNKEHIKVSKNKWTDDKDGIYNQTISQITLPEIGSKLKVVVTHVVSPSSFYVRLPDAFSGSKDAESINHLIATLNDPSTHKELTLLKSPPCFSQFLSAFSETTKQWLRASVCDIYDDYSVQIFFVDVGITEEVSIDKCREILPQFNHLPSQAVYTTLSGVFRVDSSINEGGKFLNSYILNKDIEITVTERNESDNLMEVEAFLNNVKLNELVVQKGFCSKLHK